MRKLLIDNKNKSKRITHKKTNNIQNKTKTKTQRKTQTKTNHTQTNQVKTNKQTNKPVTPATHTTTRHEVSIGGSFFLKTLDQSESDLSVIVTDHARTTLITE